MIKLKERLYKWLFAILAFASLVFLVGIVIVLFKEGLPVFKKVGVLEFLFGKFWYPTYDPPEFGILPLILASLWISVGAILVCLPLGVGSALYLNEMASHRQKQY